jgi:two-component system, NarL family, uhpT operon response regulator UhpA
MSDSVPKVAIVDDHEMIRIGFNGLTAYGIDIGTRAASVDDLLVQEKDAENRSAIVVLDVFLNDGSWVAENVRRLRAAGYRVVILTYGALPEALRDALAAGASALVAKSDQLAPLADAVHAVHDGAPLYVSALMAHVVYTSDVELTSLQRETLRHAVGGLTTKEIAALMSVPDDEVVACFESIASAYRAAYPDTIDPARARSTGGAQ